MSRAKRSRAARAASAEQRIETLLASVGHTPVPLPPHSRSCDGKTQYGERLARIVATETSAESGERIEAYACHYCPAWHVGHPAYGPNARLATSPALAIDPAVTRAG